ncbi:hypothetical protein O3G_MSEX002447 [Manduca sexta]|nr:hypothetical protein O3G_MSEX002447 [Manduca sexta]
MFRLCYKLLSDPSLRYNLPLNVLPLDLQMTLERGPCPQFYADILSIDSQTMNVVALALNPFDYYIFHFALHLISNSQNKSSWESWNSVYFALACDYLMHFLPTDPNIPVLPHIPNYTGKVPIAAPLQTANRPLHSPSLLLLPDLTGSSINNQHTSQAQSRNEIWRSETVMQAFIDIWMSVEQIGTSNIEMYKRSCPVNVSSPERVRTVRVLVKHLHSFPVKDITDSTFRSSSLRKYARQKMCARAYYYLKHLVTTWPLDASFRLVMELWLSLIQPWRYVNRGISLSRFPGIENNIEENNTNNLDASYTQFIAENFPSYTCIFQLVIPRFMRLDITAYKNAAMLFRLGKVFSQQHLVPILRNLEQAIIDSGNTLSQSLDSSFYPSSHDHSYTYNGVALHKWVAIAKQAISELNLSANFEYEPVWSDNTRPFIMELIKRIISSKVLAEKNLEELNKKLNTHNEGTWASIKLWLMINNQNEDDRILFEECKKVPIYLKASVHYFSVVFGLNENTLITPEQILEDNSLDHSSFVNSTSFPLSITNKLRSKSTKISYMGDPDLMPITSYESTIIIRMLYQIALRLNEVYGDKFSVLWNRQDFWGYVAREILQAPCEIQTYMKDITNHQTIERRELPARLSLRRFGSHAFVLWVIIGYIVFKLFSLSGFFYIFVLFSFWMFQVLIKASLKKIKLL